MNIFKCNWKKKLVIVEDLEEGDPWINSSDDVGVPWICIRCSKEIGCLGFHKNSKHSLVTKNEYCLFCENCHCRACGLPLDFFQYNSDQTHRHCHIKIPIPRLREILD